jgi:hypothetical protein
MLKAYSIFSGYGLLENAIASERTPRLKSPSIDVNIPGMPVKKIRFEP